MNLLTVRDKAIGGGNEKEFSLLFPSNSITVRELIETRVKHEVDDYNAKLGDESSPIFRGLVQPNDSEVAINGCKLKAPRAVDFQAQFESAIQGFQQNQIFVLVNDKQCESLEEQIEVKPETVVIFLRLLPLVGG